MGMPVVSDGPRGSVGLQVLGLQREVGCYERFGLTRIEDGAGSATLGTGGRPLLRLKVLPRGQERPRHTAGLFHFAILLPREEELGGFLTPSLQAQPPLTPTAPHFSTQPPFSDLP